MTRVAIRAIVAEAVTLVDAAATCRREAGFTLAQCAPELASTYPKTPASELASVLCAVWPEQATPTALAEALRSCRTWTESVVTEAASGAARTAHDLYVRDGLTDDGSIPFTASEPYQSPDIVPNPADPEALATAWDADLGTELGTGSVVNRIHVRARNAYPGPRSGKVHLYWSTASLLMSPSTWVQNRIPNQNGTDAATLTAAAPGDLVVGDQPFLWQTGEPADGDHFCLIAQVITEFQPNMVPANDSLDTFIQWVRDHPGVAWRNNTHVSVSPGVTRALVVSFRNPDPVEREFVLSVACANLPVGTIVAVSCVRPPIASTRTITETPTQTLVLTTAVPAGLAARLIIEVTPPDGAELPDTMTITPTYLLSNPGVAALAAHAQPAAELGIDHPDATGDLVYLGDYVFTLLPR